MTSKTLLWLGVLGGGFLLAKKVLNLSVFDFNQTRYRSGIVPIRQGGVYQFVLLGHYPVQKKTRAEWDQSIRAALEKSGARSIFIQHRVSNLGSEQVDVSFVQAASKDAQVPIGSVLYPNVPELHDATLVAVDTR